MWDNNAPLQLLKTMPSKLNQEHLEKIQMLIDADKYKNSIISGFDLCGIFAPFCRGCDRTSIYPCAVSYIRMLQSEGMNIEIDASPSCFYTAKYKPTMEIPQTKPRANSAAFDRVGVRNPVDNKYRENRSGAYKEVKSEIALTEVEQTVQTTITEEKTSEKKTVEKKTETKPEIPVVKQPVETVAPKKPEKAERIEAKPVDDKKLRIAVARRKLNF
ncbi:MAG: hypothetical protein K2J83_00055 [Clostridia bacterium]|nr:hypothetical protein [Clostridia bacterium]